MRTKLSIFSIGIALCFFMAIWLFSTQEGWADHHWESRLKGIGSGIGVVGYLLFSLSLFLSSRWQKIEDWLGGLDKIYHLHHQLGIWSFSLILVHSSVIAAKWIPQRFDKFFLFFFPSHHRWSVNFGSIAFWLMVLIIGITIIKMLPYHIWKISHQCMGLVFLFASYHVLFSENKFYSSNLSNNLLIIPFAIGLFGIFYKQVFIPFLTKHPLFEVIKTNHVNDNVVEITLKPKEKKLNYSPGQYVFFSFKDEKITRESHPFTLSGFTNETTISILVKSRGDFTRSLYQHIRPGITADLEGPYGRFDFTKARNSQIWIGGGIGIVPFIAWVRSFDSTHADKNIKLFYSYHRKKDAIFVEEFDQISRNFPHFQYFLFCSEENNRIDAQKVSAISHGLQEKDILMCGPKRLTDDLTNQFKNLGIKRKNILFEDFEFF